MLKKGYILFPKALFEEQIKEMKGASGTFDAFVLVLTHVNYSTMECCINHQKFECKRGESMMSIDHWMKIFRWTRGHTRYFFDTMYKHGVFEKIPNPYTTHFRIPEYDLLVGQKPRESKPAVKDTVAFTAFWDKFHEVTQKPKTNIGLARREWKKLSGNERKLCMCRIEEYYDNLKDTRYCLQASSYLINKAFLNEYNY